MEDILDEEILVKEDKKVNSVKEDQKEDEKEVHDCFKARDDMLATVFKGWSDSTFILKFNMVHISPQEFKKDKDPLSIMVRIASCSVVLRKHTALNIKRGLVNENI